MQCNGMFRGPFCHAKWLPILIYTPLSCRQHLHMSTHYVNLIRQAQTGGYYSAVWHRLQVSMLMIYIHSHTRACRLFLSFGSDGLAVRSCSKRGAVKAHSSDLCVTVYCRPLCLGVSDWMHAMSSPMFAAMICKSPEITTVCYSAHLQPQKCYIFIDMSKQGQTKLVQ